MATFDATRLLIVYILVNYCTLDNAQNTSAIDSCFSAFQTDIGALMSSTLLTSYNECMSYCYNNPNCLSAVWDQTTCLCYQYKQKGSKNPAILLNRVGSDYYEKTCASIVVGTTTTASLGVKTTVLLQTTTAPAEEADPCTDDSKYAYFLTTGTELVPEGSDDQMVEYTEENECITQCSAADWCQSITMYPKSKTCMLSVSSLAPDGTASSTSNQDTFYVERFCAPASVPDTCSEQFFYLFPNKSLAEQTLSTVTAGTLAACASKCTTTAGCKAGVYDSNTKMCVLKKETTVTANTSLRPAAETVYYFENGCLVPSLRKLRDSYRRRLRAKSRKLKSKRRYRNPPRPDVIGNIWMIA